MHRGNSPVWKQRTSLGTSLHTQEAGAGSFFLNLSIPDKSLKYVSYFPQKIVFDISSIFSFVNK